MRNALKTRLSGLVAVIGAFIVAGVHWYTLGLAGLWLTLLAAAIRRDRADT